jgi:TusA-related sulfurtransferase
MNADNINISEYDMQGQICPSCLLIALQKVNMMEKELRSGSHALHILTDSRHSTTTIPDAVRNMGYLVEVEKDPDEGFYRIKIFSA